jgi:nicotinamide mononucleotide transporter
MTTLEIVANILNLLGVYLAAKNKVATWPVGIVGCLLYAVMFFEVKLYADVTLQFFYIATSFYGWHIWKKGGEDKKELPVTRVNLKKLALYSLIGLLTSALYGFMLLKTTDASYPFIDSVILSFSVIGQLLMMKRKLECWPVWILVNTLSIPLFVSKGLNLTAFVYALFWVNAVWGHFQWKNVGKEVHP